MAIFKYELRQLRGYTIWWSVACALLIYAMFPVYLSMITTGALNLGEFADNSLFELLGVDPVTLITPIGVFAFLTSFFAIAAGISGMFLGLKIFTKETIDKSAEFLYTKPYKRKNIYLAKVGAAFVCALIIGIAYLLGALFARSATVPDLDMTTFILIGLSFLFIQLFFVFLGALIGSIYSKIRAPMLFSTGVAFLFYVTATVSTKAALPLLKYITPFAQFSSNTVARTGGYEIAYLIAFGILCVLFFIGGYFTFTKKDITLIA